MGFGALRVINDDTIQPDEGFSMHPHQNMEIITIVTKGALTHQDSEGNESTTHAGEIQYMSAGSGIYHSEFNASKSEILELFQIWIRPESKGGKPSYTKKDFSNLSKNRWHTLISHDGSGDSITIKQDASIAISHLESGHTLPLAPIPDGHGFLLFIIDGEVEVLNDILHPRDEMQITYHEKSDIKARQNSSLLLFDVPLKPKSI